MKTQKLFKMKNLIISLTIIISTCSLSAQDNLISIQPNAEYDNIHVQKLYNDSLSTSYVIWIKDSVRLHKHQFHTESLYIIEGTAEMKLGEKQFTIKEGDFITIPKNTVHSAKVTSTLPLKVISVQAPEFLGKDRIFVD